MLQQKICSTSWEISMSLHLQKQATKETMTSNLYIVLHSLLVYEERCERQDLVFPHAGLFETCKIFESKEYPFEYYIIFLFGGEWSFVVWIMLYVIGYILVPDFKKTVTFLAQWDKTRCCHKPWLLLFSRWNRFAYLQFKFTSSILQKWNTVIKRSSPWHTSVHKIFCYRMVFKL